jgi:hypothetical protein
MEAYARTSPRSRHIQPKGRFAISKANLEQEEAMNIPCAANDYKNYFRQKTTVKVKVKTRCGQDNS